MWLSELKHRRKKKNAERLCIDPTRNNKILLRYINISSTSRKISGISMNFRKKEQLSRGCFRKSAAKYYEHMNKEKDCAGMAER